MSELTWEQLLPNIFFVRKGDVGVVYAPLLGKFFSANEEGFRIIQDYKEGGKSEEHDFHKYLKKEGFLAQVELPRRAKEGSFNSRDVTISVTSACNLRCIYCYANGGVNFTDLPWPVIERSIQQLFIFGQERGDKDIELCFHGTGETTVRWKIMVKAVNYALDLLPEDWKLGFSIVTNGTLIDDEKASFFKKNNFSVVLSMDGIEPIQNQLRPKANGEGSFNDVVRGIQALGRHKVTFAIRTTVTGLNQDTMVDFLELCASLGCKEISVAPFSMTGRGEEGVPDVNPEIFVKNYLLAKKRAKILGVNFSTPSDCLDNASARYCNADGESMAVMPEGIISTCTRVTRKSDELAKVFVVGQVVEDSVQVDQEKVEKLKNFNLYNFPECEDCFAKFTCGGGCHHTRLINGGKQPETYCKIIQAVVWDTLKNAALSI